MLKNRLSIKLLLYVEIILLLFFISSKLYLLFFESNYYSLNAQAVSRIKHTKKAISFAVLGNIKNSRDVMQRIILRLNRSHPDFVISVGNAVLDGGEDKYRALYKSIQTLNMPIVFVPGRREISDNGRMRFWQHFGPFDFSFSAGNAYFILLDSTEKENIIGQKSWLVTALNESEKYKYRFVFMNAPPYPVKKDTFFSQNQFFSDDYFIANDKTARFFLQNFKKYKVTSVFSSSIEIYNKRVIDGVTYFITGGAGGGLYLNDNRSFYHYILVDIAKSNVSYRLVRIKKNTYMLTTFAKNALFYFHSLLYVNFENYLIFFLLIFVAILIIYIQATKKVDYYAELENRKIDIPVDLKLRIAMFTNTYFPFLGGVGTSVKRLADGLRKAGHTVYIFAPQYPNQPADDDGFIIRCKAISFHKNKGNILIANIYDPKIEKIFRTLRIDIIHSHHPYWMGQKGLHLSRKYNLPVVFTYHTRLEKYAHNIPVVGKLFENKIPHTIIKKYAQKCDTIFAPTKIAKKYLRSIGVSRYIKILPTGVDFDIYKKIDEQQIAKLVKKYTAQNEILLFSASRLTKEKNLLFLLSGLKYIKEHSTVKFKCLIAGGGPERDNCLHFIKKNNLTGDVELLGELSEQAMALHYRMSDIFIFASRSETQGIVLLEAMAGGTPIVAVTASGIEDMIKDKITGFKTETNIKDWAQKIILLMSDPLMRHEMSKNTIAFAKNFSSEKIAGNAANAYKYILLHKLAGNIKNR